MNEPIRQPKLGTVAGYAVAFLFAAITIASCSLAPRPANAGTVRRSNVCRVVQKAVVAQAVAAYPLSYYTVAPQLQRQAVDTYDFRQSAEYLEYLELKGFEAGVKAMQRQAPQPPAQYTDSAATSASAPASSPTNEPTSSPAEATNPKWESFQQRYPLVAQHCSNCHGRQDPLHPAGDLYLDGGSTLEGADGAAKRDAMLSAVANERMPKHKPLDPQLQWELMVELYRNKAN